MTDLDLDAIEARANAATDGPWGYPFAGKNRITTPVDIDITQADWGGENLREYVLSCLDDRNAWRAADAEFIAHARTDVPALAKRLRAVLTLCEQRIAEHADYVRRIQDGTLITLDRFIGPAQVNVDDVLAALDVRHDPSATTEGDES